MKRDDVVKTQFQREKEAKDLAVYQEFNELMAVEGAMVTAIEQHLMEKYNIHAKSTIWTIRRRVEKRLREEGQ